MSETFKLKYPVSHGGKTYDELTLRRPKNRDIEKVDSAKGSETKRSIELLADLAQVPPDVIRELDVEDTAAINAWLKPILNPKDEDSKGDGS